LGEILALQWSDLDLVKGRVVVRRNFWRGHLNETPKGGRTRSVDLPGSVITALKAHRHVKGPWVFCTAKGHPLTDKQLNGLLSKAVRRAGIARDEGRIGWHDLRHTYGSHLAMRAVPLRTIQELMGHATIEMTMRYAHLSPEITRDAVKQLDEAAPGAQRSRGPHFCRNHGWLILEAVGIEAPTGALEHARSSPIAARSVGQSTGSSKVAPRFISTRDGSPTPACNDVTSYQKALADLLELALSAGVDEAHPALVEAERLLGASRGRP
jgi:hypothetical protein